jgi:hypothetical protein
MGGKGERWEMGKEGDGKGGRWVGKERDERCERREMGGKGERWEMGKEGDGRWERREMGDGKGGRWEMGKEGDWRWERREMGKEGDGKGGRWERREMGKEGDGKGGRWERRHTRQTVVAYEFFNHAVSKKSNETSAVRHPCDWVFI